MDTPAVHVVAMWYDDGDCYSLGTCEPGEHDDESTNHEGDVPAEVWQRRNDALNAWQSAEREIIELLDLEDGGRRRTPCEAWQGYEYPGSREHWVIAITPSDGSEWPIRDARVGFLHNSEDDAVEYLAALPDEFWLAADGPHPVRVVKQDRLSIVHVPAHPGYAYSCHCCGHDRDDHAPQVAG